MKPLGYTYSDGSVLCVDHAADEDNETGQAFPIFADSETHADLVCDVEGCGVILEKNCVDGCEGQ
jgi:hypothetical protein